MSCTPRRSSYDKPVVVETTRVVDDPPKVIERRHYVDDTPPRGKKPTVVAREGRQGRYAQRRASPRVIEADAEVTIIGPDRNEHPAVPQGQPGESQRGIIFIREGARGYFPIQLSKQPTFPLMVRSAAKPRVSNHESPCFAAILRDAALRAVPQDEVREKPTLRRPCFFVRGPGEAPSSPSFLSPRTMRGRRAEQARRSVSRSPHDLATMRGASRRAIAASYGGRPRFRQPPVSAARRQRASSRGVLVSPGRCPVAARVLGRCVHLPPASAASYSATRRLMTAPSDEQGQLNF